MVGPSTVETVRFAGGWLFDRVMAGWDVTVLSPADANPRPLRILGVRALDPTGAEASGAVRPQAIAVDAGLYASSDEVRRMVQEAIDAGVGEVRLWDGSSAAPDRGPGPIQHRLSLAAVAFKTHALAAADQPAGAVGVTESFRSGRLTPPLTPPPRVPDRVPAA